MARRRFLVLSSMLAIAACSDDHRDAQPGSSSPAIAIPRGAALPAMAITVTPTYKMQDGFPTQFDGHVYLRVDPVGAVTGALSVGSFGQSVLASVTGHVDGATIVLDAGVIYAAPGQQLQWDELRLTVLDQDGDRVIDGATGEARGTFTSGGEYLQDSSYTAAIAPTNDAAATSAKIFDHSPRLPFGVAVIDFSAPVTADQVTALRVLAGGAPVAGSFDAAPVAGLITRASFQPADFLPFDQPISLDVTALADPSGNPILATASALRVVPDPSSITTNLGFEDGLVGWSVVGHAENVGSFGGLAPVEGSSQAKIDAVGALAGYLDVPDDAAALHLSLARLSQLAELANDYTASVTLHRANGDTIASFDARQAPEQVVPCTTCGADFGFQLGPLTRDLDLTAVRGERVWLTVDATSFFFIGMPALAVVVDDLRIVTAK
jgi:hypothetical protein